MAHKITITGRPIDKIRLVPELMDKTKNPNRVKVFAFELRENGSEGTPKRLPKPSNVTFTVFVNDTQLKRSNLDPETLHNIDLVISGVITLKVKPLVPGHMGIVTLTIAEKAIKRQKEEDEQEKAI